MKEINAQGLACPMPVVLTKREMDAGERLIMTKVDNAAAVANLTRLGESMGYTASAQESGGIYNVLLSAEGSGSQTGESAQKTTTPEPAKPLAAVPTADDWAVLVGADSLGRGSDELGSTLLTMFFYTLSQSDNLPAYILFLNGGVKVPTENTEAIGHLQALAGRGCEILSCGTCLNYYGLKEKLQVGEASNMYEILTRLQKAAKVISL